jgi:hypothetical protein
MTGERGRCFEIIDALDGLFQVVKRSPTLDGSLPLRAAQACVPLLEGNALGFTLKLTRPARLERRLGRLRFVPGELWPDAELVQSRLARLAAEHLVPARGAFRQAFGRAPALADRGVLWIWTGLLVRPADGIWARVGRPSNRRNLFVDVRETFAAPGAFTPIVLGLAPHFGGGQKTIEIAGDLATLAPAMADLDLVVRELADAPDLGRAHAEFYDASYFSSKKKGSTRRYRKLVAKPVARQRGAIEIVRAGPCPMIVARDGLVASAAEPIPSRTRDGAPPRVRFLNLVDFEARYDGKDLRLRFERDALRGHAAALERAWTELYGAKYLADHQGALFYLIKYFTPHVAGEPHFFVKPWAFVRTPPGWSSVVEGVAGDGFDVMRGVVETDRFFATPAVFHLHRLGAPIRVAAKDPLVDVYPVPRDVLGAGFTRTRLGDDALKIALK